MAYSELTHDEAMEKLFEEYNVADKKRYTNFFLSALSDSKFNSGLYAYAVMKTFPKHVFLRSTENMADGRYCAFCGAFHVSVSEFYDYYEDNHFVGALYAHDVYEKLYILHRINRLDNVPSITEQDFDIFKEIISCLQSADHDTKIRDILKQLKKAFFFKPWMHKIKTDGIGKDTGITRTAEQKIQSILETLGVCGILHTEKHKGSFYEYINLGLAPKSAHRSDWDYPVDFWRGRNGINWQNFEYWFGDYEELKDIRLLSTSS